jgi:hypothetical protein
MISLDGFVRAIHDAVMQAHDSLMTSNIDVLDEFFEHAEGTDEEESTLVPKTVVVQYPSQSATGELGVIEVHVPLITLVPLSIAQIREAKLSINFDLHFANDELLLCFAGNSNQESDSGGPNEWRNGMEISVVPHAIPEGLKMLIEGYQAVLKRQIP